MVDLLSDLVAKICPLGLFLIFYFLLPSVLEFLYWVLVQCGILTTTALKRKMRRFFSLLVEIIMLSWMPHIAYLYVLTYPLTLLFLLPMMLCTLKGIMVKYKKLTTTAAVEETKSGDCESKNNEAAEIVIGKSCCHGAYQVKTRLSV